MTVFKKSFIVPEFDKKEILRYALCKDTDENITALVDECIKECENAFTYNVCWCELPVKITDDKIELSFLKTGSKALLKNISGCKKIILFGATVGLEIDRLIAKYGTLSPTRALCLQAIGTERVEALCDEAERHILSLLPHGSRLCPRYSPGYGDLPLSAQQAVFSLLSPEKSIGLYLNASLLMSPTKSVTAVIGILRKEDSV